LFVVAVVLMASAPWVLLQPDQQTRTELNRWFLNGRSLHSTTKQRRSSGTATALARGRQHHQRCL